MAQPDGGEEPSSGGRLSGSEIRRKAVSGAAVIGARGVAINLLAFVGNVALARLLVPEDYGTVALGVALLTLFVLLSDGGLGAGLVRRPEPPTDADLRALMAIQVLAAGTIAAAAVAVGLAFGRTGTVIAVILASVPLLSLRGPGMVVLQRELEFRPIAAVEVCEVLAYYAFGIGAVAAGLGVWGLAAASSVKALVGTVILLRARPSSLVRPLASMEHVRPLLRFGLRFQGVQLVSSIRDQGASVGTAIVAGPAVLALWTIAWRLLQVPFLLFHALWQVSFPAMSQLVANGEDPKPIVEKVVRLAALGTGLLLTALVSSSPSLIPALFGARYAGAADALPFACAALQISGPVSVATAGYLFATGHAGTVLRVATVQVFVWFGIAFPLLPLIGVSAVGIGFCVAALTETVIFSRVVRSSAGARLAPGFVAPFVAAAVASTAGWLAAEATGPTILGGVAGAAAGAALYLAAMLLIRRALVIEVAAFARRGAGSLVRA